MATLGQVAMARTPHVAETGSIGINDDDINMCPKESKLVLWTNTETGRSPLASAGQSGITVGDEVASVMTGEATDASGGFVPEDGGQTKAMMARRESKRAPSGFDNPNMDAETFDLATAERIEAEAEADKRSTEIAFKYHAIEIMSQAKGSEIASRAEKCRQAVTSMERRSRTVGHGWFEAHTEPTTQEPRPDNRVSDHVTVPDAPEHTPDNRDHVEALKEQSEEQLEEIREEAERLAGRFAKQTLTVDYITRCMARRILNGESVFSAVFTVKQEIETITEVVQPLNAIDPYGQQATTVVVTVDKLFDPKGDGQRQVGYVSDDSGEQVKLTVWFNAGDKPTLKEGDTVKLTDTKVNAYNGDATLAVVSDTEINHVEHGDGEGTRAKKRSDNNPLPSWDADSDTHAWHNGVAEQMEGESDKTDLETELLNLWVTDKINQEQYDKFLNSSGELSEEDKDHVCEKLVEYRK